jgi:hypothetical protein
VTDTHDSTGHQQVLAIQHATVVFGDQPTLVRTIIQNYFDFLFDACVEIGERFIKRSFKTLKVYP